MSADQVTVRRPALAVAMRGPRNLGGAEQAQEHQQEEEFPTPQDHYF